MAGPNRTPLAYRFLRLPRFLDFELDIKPELEKAKISEDIFELDCQSDPNNIPLERLKAYAEILNCKVVDLKMLSSRQE